MSECFVSGGSMSEFEPYTQVFSSSGSFTVPSSGTYRITAIGQGAPGHSALNSHYDGGCGGGGYVEKKLNKGEVLTISISSSAVVSGVISATAGNGPTAGTVSGAGVVAFSSNGKATKDIVPPAFYNRAPYISYGGTGGDKFASSGVLTESAGNSGGKGCFGGCGGRGGLGGMTYDSGYKSVLGKGTTGNDGGGNGGAGKIAGSQATPTSGHGGGGGGGGYGGGGGHGTWNQYYNYGETETHADSGTGGAACVFIERIS